MEMAKGRNFSKDFLSDSTGIILNEAAVKVLGFKDPLKETLYRPDFSSGSMQGATGYHIVGIVKDFNFSSMHQNVGPLIIQLGDNWGGIAVRVNTKNINSVINTIQTRWSATASGQPFNYTFMDDDFNKGMQQSSKPASSL
jgi:putative ABC transport system permease protein